MVGLPREDVEIDIVPDEMLREVGLAPPITRLLNDKVRSAISRAGISSMRPASAVAFMSTSLAREAGHFQVQCRDDETRTAIIIVEFCGIAAHTRDDAAPRMETKAKRVRARAGESVFNEKEAGALVEPDRARVRDPFR